MAPAPSLCTLCLRASRTAPIRASKPSFSTQSRPYSLPSTTAPRPLYLDFLAPAALSRPPRRPARNLVPGLSSSCNAVPSRPPAPRRRMATQASPTAAPSEPQPMQPILNPRTSESGEPMRVSISPRATHRLSKIAATDNNPELALRVTVESGGCHGFQYLMTLDDLSKKPATEEDTLFEDSQGAKVIIDESSLELLNGSTVDYTMELIGSQFKVTGIPGATSSCGCGTSFDIKLD